MISFFQLLPRAHDHTWDLGRRLTCKLKALTSGSALSQQNRPLQHPHHCRRFSNLSLSISCSIFPSLVNKTSNLELLHLGRRLSLCQSEESNVFQLRTMASDLEVLTLIPAASRPTAIQPSESWWTLFNDANRTSSSCKYQRRNPEATELDSLRHLAVAGNSELVWEVERYWLDIVGQI